MKREGRRAVLRGQYVPSRSKGRFWYDEPISRSRVFSSADLSTETVGMYARALREFAPSVLHAYPSTALMLVRLMQAAGERSPGMDLVLLGSEGFSSDERKEIEDFFRCPSFSWYGHTEKCVLASDAGDGLLAPNWFYGLVELVDAEGLPVVEPGIPGRIVGSGFLNEGTVLLRYATDDWAAWAVAPKAGGLTAARLTSITPHRGRDALVASDGSEVSLTYLHGAHEAVLTRVLEMQFVQVAPGEVRLDVVMNGPTGPETYLELEHVFSKRLAGRVSLTVHPVDRVQRSASGKRMTVRDETAAAVTSDQPKK